MDVWVLAGQGTATHGTGQVSTRQMQVLPTCQLPPTLHIYNIQCIIHTNNIHIHTYTYDTNNTCQLPPTLNIYMWHQPSCRKWNTTECVTSVANVTQVRSVTNIPTTGHSGQQLSGAGWCSSHTHDTYIHVTSLHMSQLWFLAVSFCLCLFLQLCTYTLSVSDYHLRYLWLFKLETPQTFYEIFLLSLLSAYDTVVHSCLINH